MTQRPPRHRPGCYGDPELCHCFERRYLTTGEALIIFALVGFTIWRIIFYLISRIL